MLKVYNIKEQTENGKDGARCFIVYLAVAALFLFVTSLQGISHYDIGFYLSGYKCFNSDPYASYFLGQWYLTFHFLGFVCNALGIESFLGLRVLRLLLLLVLQTIIYLYLRKYAKTKYIITGLAMSTLAQYGAYSDINYNDLTVFMLVCALLLYHKGLTTNAPLGDERRHFQSEAEKDQLTTNTQHLTPITLSGFLIGISFFLRLVNLSFVLLPFFAIAMCFYYGIKVSWWRQLVYFFLGVMLGCLLIVGIAWADGTLGVLQLTANDLTNISRDSSDPHNIRAIIRCYLVDILAELKMALFIAFVMYGYILARMQAGQRLIHLAYSILAAAIILVIWHDGLSANATVGFCLAVFLLDIYTQRLNNKQPLHLIPHTSYLTNHTSYLKNQPSNLILHTSYLFALAMFLPLVMPIGSNGTSQFYGQTMCILALPLAVSALMRGSNNPSFSTGKTAIKYIVAAICIGMTVTNVLRPMMEDGNRLQCRYAIDSKATRHLFTNKDNADLHNRMISEVKPLIPRGSHLICNFSITMIPVLECRPYGVFADGFSTQSMAERYLQTAYQRSNDGKQLPYLLVDEDQETATFAHIRTFLSSLSPYKEVWRSNNYVLLKPILQ